MDWQTKEYIDSRFDELEEKMDLIMENLNIDEDSDVEDDEIEEHSKKVI